MPSAITANCATASRKTSMRHGRCSQRSRAREFRSIRLPGIWLKEGVQLFDDAADKLLGAVAHKRTKILGFAIGQHTCGSIPPWRNPSAAKADEWRAAGTIRKLWQHDTSVWTPGGQEENKWLGWLTSPAAEFDSGCRLRGLRAAGQRTDIQRCGGSRHGG